MKKKSASKSAFFNLRVLVALFIGTTGVSLALLAANPFGRGGGPAPAAQQHSPFNKSAMVANPLVPPGFDCSKIHELGIDKMENMRAGAIMIFCGEAEGGKPTRAAAFSQFVNSLLPGPLAYGGADVDLVTGTETSPNITQSETFSTANPDNPLQVVVAYNDSRGRNVSPINISGASVSTDGGVTFTRLTDPARGNQSPFVGTEGDPVILYNKPTGTWFTIWIDTGCGGGGMGGYKSTTPSDPSAASWTHYCVHSGGSDDRESGWADNNPSSTFFGRMYMSENDFAVGGGAIFVSFTTDNGLTWTNRRQVTTSFIRNVQITGDPLNGDLYIAGMDENAGAGCGSGCGTTRNNKIYRSTDGGNTWTNTYTGPSFVGPCRSNSGFFCTMYSSPAYWRHMGWGEPAAYNHVVSLVYAQKDGSDPGNVYYIRSTDSGATFGAPFQLNANTDVTKAQWQPNLSVSNAGTLFATWYDETPRVAASCQPSSPSTPCYQMHSRKSNDNGVTWLADDTLSDVASPLPLQPDPGIVGTYVGDYDYGSAILVKHVTSWADGRVAINGASQQDAFTDRELVGFAVTSTTPACNSVINTQPVDFTVNLSDAVNTSTVGASDFTVNGIASNLAPTFQNGNLTIIFHYTTSPVTVQGVQTMHIPANAFTRVSDGQGNFAFDCTFCYTVTPLMVTTTNPPVGGSFTGPGTRTLDVNWNQAVDPSSVQDNDLTLSGVAATVTGHALSNGNTTVTWTINFTSIFSGTLTVNVAAGAITAQGCNANAAFTANYQYTGNVCDSGLIQNEGFETGSLPPWVIDGHTNDPVVATNFVHTGTHSAFAGGNPQQNTYCEENNNEPLGDSSFYQQFGPVPASATLSFWHKDCTNDSITFDWQDAYITDSNGNILQTIYHLCDTADWTNVQVSMTPYVGQTVRIKFLVHQDGFNPPGDTTGQWVDDVVLYAPCGTPTPTATASPSPSPTSTATLTPTPTPSPTASPSCTPGAFHVLIAYADIGGPPTTLQSQILAEPGVTAVDLFDAFSGTPTLQQLQQYQIVVAFSNNVYSDPVGMGNVLADYADTGGVVVGLNFDWFGPPFGLDGRWITGGYTPFNSGPTNFTSSCLGTYDTTHPLMQGISAGSLCAFFRHTLTLSPGAVSVALYQDNQQLCAYKTNNGHTGVGINAYLGANPENFSGPFGRVVVNAGRWLIAPPCGTPTPTATVAGTATPTPTCAAGWSAGPNMPTVLVRAVGVYFPDGNFYTMGGRTADTAGSDFQHVLKYNPGTNSWTQQGVTLPDNTMNNMACGVLTVSGTPLIYCVGGSAAGQTTATARVFFYNPATDVVTTLTGADDWPGDAAGTILPGGFAETGNKMYILGGFNINVASTNQIWQFDPTAAVGSKWLQRVNTPVGIMYAPTCAIGGIIYVGGASDYSGGTVIDTTNSFKFDPVGNTTSSIAAIPRATGETRGLTFNGNMYVMGGGRVAPNPSTQVNIYNPGTDTWSLGLPFNTPRRNFPTDTNGTDHIWLSGGYDSSGVTPLASMEIFAGACPSPTPTATATPTVAGTVSPTPTCQPGGTPGPWTQAAPVAIDHYGGFMDSNGTVAWEGGGYSFSQSGNINQFGRFDPVANTWTPLAPVPDLNNGEASGVYAPNVNKLFVFGGENVTTATVVNTTRIYDIATNTWSTGTPMPDVRAFMGSGYFNGKIYLVGGYNTGNVDPSFGQVWEYDPVANTFNTSRASMPATLGGPGFGIINGHIYIAGGRNLGSTNLNTLYDYDIAANTWTARANLPTGVNVPGSAVIGGKLWVLGGGNPFNGSGALPQPNKGVLSPDTTNILQIYDPVANAWTSGPNLLQTLSFPVGTHVGNTAVVVGGYTGSTTTTSVEKNVVTGGCASPTPTATFTPTATPTATRTPTATPTATRTPTPTATATSTPTPTATVPPRVTPTPRPRPTPPPRP